MFGAVGKGDKRSRMKERNFGVRIALLGLWSGVILLIFLFSSQSYREQTIQPFLRRTLPVETAVRILPDLEIRYNGKEYAKETNPFGLIEFLFRKGAHLFVYGMLAAMTALTLQVHRRRDLTVVLFAMMTVLLTALLDEWNQTFSSSRTPAWQDVFVDLTGGMAGLAVFFGIRGLSRLIRR